MHTDIFNIFSVITQMAHSVGLSADIFLPHVAKAETVAEARTIFVRIFREHEQLQARTAAVEEEDEEDEDTAEEEDTAYEEDDEEEGSSQASEEPTTPMNRKLSADAIKKAEARALGFIPVADHADMFGLFYDEPQRFVELVRALEEVAAFGWLIMPDELPHSLAWEMVFHTPEIIMRNSAGRKMSMGSYKLRLWWDRHWQVVVKRFKGNRVVHSGHYHPFLSSRGSPCWGSAAGTVSKLTKVSDLVQIIHMLKNLLTTYDSDAVPYHSWSQFALIRVEQ